MTPAQPRPPVAGRYPLFAERDGHFVALSLGSPTAVALQARLRSLPLPERVSVYLRGSRLEELEPHPDADLDLIVIAADVEARRRSWAVLEPWSRTGLTKVDLMAVTPEEVESCAAIRLLLATRSLHLAGPARTFSAVAADIATLQAHARRYHPWRIADNLSLRPARRLCELKLLTRAFGVWSRLERGPFSRDIATCLCFADQLAAAAARVLRRAWNELPACPPLDVADVKRALLSQTILTHAGAWTASHGSATVTDRSPGRTAWEIR